LRQRSRFQPRVSSSFNFLNHAIRASGSLASGSIGSLRAGAMKAQKQRAKLSAADSIVLALVG
jgi:hypothetical protein